MSPRALLVGLFAPVVLAGCSPGASAGADTAANPPLMQAAAPAPPADFLRSCLIVAPQAGLLDQDLTAGAFANALAQTWRWEKQKDESYIIRQVRNDAVSQRQVTASYLLQPLSPAALRQYGQDYAPARCGPSAVVLSRIVEDGAEYNLGQIYQLAMQVVVANYHKTEAAKAEARPVAQASIDAQPVSPPVADEQPPVAAPAPTAPDAAATGPQ